MRQWKAIIENDEPLPFNLMLISLQSTLPQLVDFWRAKITGYRPRREERPKKITLQRDNYRCVLLGSHGPPYSQL
ncbi:hypothetical protein LY78DRAFT_660779 [Colletotrichum sublineola]|nr:hypothetical protein LY78DRAFT_660779 [Colletotrichum sublineola]